MRKVTFGAANSLDNFIARADHGVDWLRWDPEVEAVTGAFGGMAFFPVAGGRIVEDRALPNLLGVLQQPGAAPTPTGAAA